MDMWLFIPYLYADETAWIIKAYLRIGRIFEDKEEWEQAKKIYKKIIEYKTSELKIAQERIEWINEHALLGLIKHWSGVALGSSKIIVKGNIVLAVRKILTFLNTAKKLLISI